MSVSEVIALFSGIALFLFGMSLMGDGLKKVSGNQLEPILYRMSGTVPRGVLLGTGVTAVIQSSCATAVMTVGFVNSGMMKTRQGIGVILGAILGTSVTGWVICLSYISGSGVASLISTATITGIVSVAGIILRMFSKKQTQKTVGDILIGFAVLMFGMSTMSQSVSGLGEQSWFLTLLTSMSNPIVGILIGALVTAILQSASAAVGIVQALSFTGAMQFSAALPLLMGIAIGAGVPVLVSAIGANTEGKRTAASYILAATLGVAFSAVVFYTANLLFRFDFLNTVMHPFSMAVTNSLLRLVITVALMPFVNALEALTRIFVRGGKAQEDDGMIRLEERFLPHPALAIDQSKQAINEMADLAAHTLSLALSLIPEYSQEVFAQVEKAEGKVDKYEDSLGTYLVKLTGRDIPHKLNMEVSEYLHTLSDFERISDHSLNLAESARELNEKGIRFSADAAHELSVLSEAVRHVVSIAVEAFHTEDVEKAKRVEPLEELIDDLCDKMKLNHVRRLQQGKCTIPLGFIFNDIVTNCERVSDHCSNIAVAMIELSDDSFDTHEYLDELREKRTPEFTEAYQEYSQKYHF